MTKRNHGTKNYIDIISGQPKILLQEKEKDYLVHIMMYKKETGKNNEVADYCLVRTFGT